MNSAKIDGQGSAIALLSTATWATAGIFIRWLPGWSPFAILSGRFLVASIALLPVVLSTSIRGELFRSIKSPHIWLLSLPMIGGYLLGTTAFQLAPVGEVTLLISTPPIFVVAYKRVKRIPIYKSERIGTLLSTVGVGLILLPQLMSDRLTSWQSATGYFFALSAAALLAIYVLWFKSLAQQGKTFKSVNVVFVTCIAGSILSFLFTTLISNPTGPTGLDQNAIGVLLGLGILSTATSTLCYTMAAQRLPALLAAALLLTEPIFAVLFASVALQEIPSIWFGIGSVFVLGGLLSIAQGQQNG